MKQITTDDLSQLTTLSKSFMKQIITEDLSQLTTLSKSFMKQITTDLGISDMFFFHNTVSSYQTVFQLLFTQFPWFN